MKNLVLFALVGILQSCSGQSPAKKSADGKDGYQYRTAGYDGTGKFYMGREIAPVMGPGGMEWLDRPARQEEENTALAISHLPVTAESVVADVGAGTGYYSFKIAPLVPKGKVYAIDIQDEMISHLKAKIASNGVGNVEVVKSDSVNINLPANVLDLALMVDVYHELYWPREVLASINNSLKANGKLVLIEYRGEDPTVPIKPLHKTTVAQLSREMKASGFALETKGDFLPIQHFLVFRKIK